MLKVNVEIRIPEKEVLKPYEIDKILLVASHIHEILNSFIEQKGWGLKYSTSHEDE